jgi:uncharacterized membrane protein YccC
MGPEGKFFPVPEHKVGFFDLLCDYFAIMPMLYSFLISVLCVSIMFAVAAIPTLGWVLAIALAFVFLRDMRKTNWALLIHNLNSNGFVMVARVRACTYDQARQRYLHYQTHHLHDVMMGVVNNPLEDLFIPVNNEYYKDLANRTASEYRWAR